MVGNEGSIIKTQVKARFKSRLFLLPYQINVDQQIILAQQNRNWRRCRQTGSHAEKIDTALTLR